MSESMRQLGRALTRLFEAYAGAGDAAWFVYRTPYGCDAVQRPTLIPPLDDDADTERTDERHRQLNWQHQRGQWHLDGWVLPAVTTTLPHRSNQPG